MIDFNEVCKDKKSIAISSHIRPDGDAFGSSLAVYNYLKKQYPEKNTDIYLLDPNPVFSFLPGYDEIKTEPSDKAYDLFIALDMGDKDRLGKNKALLDNAGDVVCIDHHLDYKGIAPEANSYVVPEASSTAEMVYDVIGKDNIDDDTAVCIYTGIVCDTGVFQYSNTSRKTMETAGHLMTFGFDHSKVVREAFYEKTYRQTLLLGRSLLESILLMDKKVIVSVITQRTLRFYNATSKDLEGIVSQMMHTKGVDVAIFMHETVTGEFKVSLRSNENINVAEVAAKFGGGGHERAAGLNMSGSFYDVINNVTEEIEKQYKEKEESVRQEG
ncbi:MAG: bifunctional oligoribonuclease/PAP phosphatase NrnA [Lachnospiraceae bacterium]|nr:bifunctional oligoribonuclease/PAP phosphatase NrnA [Lachnospiraceae bacterium]